MQTTWKFLCSTDFFKEINCFHLILESVFSIGSVPWICQSLTVSDQQVSNCKCMGLDTLKHLKLIILVSSAVWNWKVWKVDPGLGSENKFFNSFRRYIVTFFKEVTFLWYSSFEQMSNGKFLLPCWKVRFGFRCLCMA